MKSCSRKILELFYKAEHSGRIIKPDAIGRVGHDEDGLVIEITWRVVDGVIEEAKFRAFANPNAIAITSLMVNSIIGKSVEEAILINENVIIEALDEFNPEYLEAYDMVRIAINDAYNNYLKRQSRKENASVTVERKISTQDGEIEEEEAEIEAVEGVAGIEIEQIEVGVSRGRGRPRKEKPEIEQIEIGEKRGRGRPRKERPEGEIEAVETEKRGRGRPRKIVEESEEVEVSVKRGRGRPRKEVDESLVEEVGVSRGRGRPRKVVDEAEIVEEGEKRGRGRPRKERPEGEEEVATEKRGRGRPRKIVDVGEQVEVGEKRGRGRPRKERPEGEIEVTGEKRGRGRPKKEVKYVFPTDLEEVIKDEEVEELISGKSSSDNVEVVAEQISNNVEVNDEAKTFVEDLIANKPAEEVDVFDADYDVFKSNIRNILAGKEVASYSAEVKTSEVNTETQAHTEVVEAKTQVESETDVEANVEAEIEVADTFETENETLLQGEQKRGRGRPRKERPEGEQVEFGEKRGRGRPRKVVEESEEVEDGEKRGRGRPKKIVVEPAVEPEAEKRGRGRPRMTPASSLTRSLTAKGVGNLHNTQDIVFASKNVTTTNININVTKTTTSNEANESVSDYSKNVNITSVQENSTVTAPASLMDDKDEEIEVASVEEVQEIEIEPTEKVAEDKPMFAYEEDDFDDEIVDEEEEDDEIDASNIKDEAPSGIADLLKALLDE